jgi:beta-N-acetylhexosaminidase
MMLFGIVIFCLCSIILFNTNNKDIQKEQMEAIILYKEDDNMIIEDKNHVQYVINSINEELGTKIILEYTNINKNVIDNIISYKVINDGNQSGVPIELQDNGIFSDYYVMAYNKLNTMAINEKISELFLVKYDEKIKKDLRNYSFGGIILDENFFNSKNKSEINDEINLLQKVSKIPLLIGVNEEGGEIVTVSNNKNIINSPFLSPSKLYLEGGIPLIKEDILKKSNLLYNLGINLNLAPVVDVSDKNSYIYERTLKEDAIKTSEYAKAVIEASKNTGVSYTLKHFPGYSNNIDTHTWVSIDNRTNEEINRDLLPFKEGIKVGAEAIMVGHNVIKSIDSNNPASISLNVHNLLRNDLDFKGIIISDDLDMHALDNISNKVLKALTKGNDLIILSDYDEAFKEISNALINNSISEELIDYHVFRILAWKYYKGLMIDEK